MKTTLAVIAAIVAIIALLYVATVPTDSPEGLTEADRAAIEQLSADYQAASRAGDWAGWTDLWTADAVYQIPEAPSLVGHAQIMENAQGFPVPTEMDFFLDDMDGSGKWAWVRGTWRFVAPATEDYPEMRMNGSVLWVVEKQPDGTWLIDTECYNLDHPNEVPVPG